MTMVGIGSVWALMTSWFTPTCLFLFLNLVIGTILLTSRIKPAVVPQHQHQHQHQLARAPSLLDRVKSFNLSLYKFESDQPADDHFNRQHNIFTTETPAAGYHEQNQYSDNPAPLSRTPSLLDRLKSINLSLYKFESDQPADDHFNQQHNIFTTEPPAAGYHEQNQYPDNPPPLARTPSLLDRLKSINLASLYRSEPEHPNSEAHHETTELEPNQSSDQDHLVKRSKSDQSSWDTTSSQPGKMKKSASQKQRLGRFKEDEILERTSVRVPATTRVEKWSDKNRIGETGSSGDEEGVDAKADDFINRFKQQLRLQRLDSLKRFGEMLKGKQS